MPDKSSILKRITDALGLSRARRILPTWMGTAQIRKAADGIFDNAVFSARTTSARYLTVVKEMVDGMLEGETDLPLARLTLKRMMQAIGYTPEGGFPETMDQDPDGKPVPPATAGTLEDLSSDRRIDFMLRTQEQLMQGAAQKLQGHDPVALRQFPAWRLVRIGKRLVPRDWKARWVLAMENLDRGDELPRDEQGNVLMDQVQLVAFKGDPIWKALGSSELFDDSMDVDYPPFAFNSGMGWAGVDQAETRALGIKGPAGETIDDVLQVLPRPKASSLGIDPEILKQLKRDLKAKDERGLLVMEGGAL